MIFLERDPNEPFLSNEQKDRKIRQLTIINAQLQQEVNQLRVELKTLETKPISKDNYVSLRPKSPR